VNHPSLLHAFAFSDNSSDREIEIIQTLLEKVLIYEETLSRTCELCAEMDCLLSFAEASRAFNYVRPEMTERNIIEVKGGRSVLCLIPTPA
jgi:DNA mismatch repair protein MSH5